MKPKTIKITYWTLTIIFSLMLLMDAIGGLMQAKEGKEVMLHLGYPMYVLTIFGIAKLLGVFAILQNKFKTIKEWAFAGFTFNFIGAFLSRAFVHDSFGLVILPVIVLAFMLVLYYFWKKAAQLHHEVIAPTYALQ